MSEDQHSKPPPDADLDASAPPGSVNPGPDDAGFFDNPNVGKAIFYGLLAACALVALSDVFYHKHGHFDFELWPAFHALFGFVAYLTIVNAAKLLRLLVKRPENYYGEGEEL